jgi:hypothetical protein
LLRWLTPSGARSRRTLNTAHRGNAHRFCTSLGLAVISYLVFALCLLNLLYPGMLLAPSEDRIRSDAFFRSHFKLIYTRARLGSSGQLTFSAKGLNPFERRCSTIQRLPVRMCPKGLTQRASPRRSSRPIPPSSRLSGPSPPVALAWRAGGPPGICRCPASFSNLCGRPGRAKHLAEKRYGCCEPVRRGVHHRHGLGPRRGVPWL